MIHHVIVVGLLFRISNPQVILYGIDEFLFSACHLFANGSEVLLENNNCQFRKLKVKYQRNTRTSPGWHLDKSQRKLQHKYQQPLIVPFLAAASTSEDPSLAAILLGLLPLVANIAA